MFSTEWEQKQFKEVFNAVCQSIRMQQEKDPNFSVDKLEGQLETEYIRIGNDWVGKGQVSFITESATIAAYEYMIEELQDQNHTLH